MPAPLAACAALFLSSLALADEAQYEAVWHSDSGASLTTAPLSLSTFIETGNALVENGLRLIDVETRELNGRRVYAGLWTNGTGSNIFVGPIGPIDMREEMEERRDQGLRLDDFEIFRTPTGGRRYIGVWRPGSGTEILTGPMEFDAFVARGEDLVADGLRLIDVEVERVDGRIVYSGLFRTGTGSNLITGPLRRPAFRLRRDQMVADGLELVDVERIRIGGTQRFVGVWSGGDGESRLSRLRSFANFFIFAQDQFNDGMRAVDFEIRVAPTSDDDGDDPDPVRIPPSPIPDLPPLPPYVDLVGGTIFRIDWSHIIEGMPQIEIPIDYLPDYLPEVDGEPVLPTGSVCGFLLIKADSAFWQVPGDPAFDQPPFNAIPNVSGQDPDSFLGGIDLWGPILGCDGTQQEWTFPLPLTTSGPFNPQNVENLSLVIQMDPPGGGANPPRIEFTPPFPEGEAADAHELWDDEWIEDMMEWAEALEEVGQLDGEYCTVSSLMVEICEETPGICPVADPEGNC